MSAWTPATTPATAHPASTSPEAQCLRDGFNGTCDGYARGHEKCGGSYADDTLEECHQLCESTSGAWMDDLDLICVEGCAEFE